MYRSQVVALARRAIVSKAHFLQSPRFLPIAIFRPIPTLPAKVTAPHQCTSIRCNSSTGNAENEVVEETPEFIWPGDWICASCRSHNYRSRTTCILCQESISSGQIFYIQGMWHCPQCNQAVRRAGSLSSHGLQLLTLMRVQTVILARNVQLNRTPNMNILEMNGISVCSSSFQTLI
jgi:Zn-finger in Ran binding protein and others